jgi:hypothetical protein
MLGGNGNGTQETRQNGLQIIPALETVLELGEITIPILIEIELKWDR